MELSQLAAHIPFNKLLYSFFGTASAAAPFSTVNERAVPHDAISGDNNRFNTQDNRICQKAKALMEQIPLPKTEQEVAHYFIQLKAVTQQKIEQYKTPEQVEQFMVQEQKEVALLNTVTSIKVATTKYLHWMDQHARGTRFLTRFSHFYHGSSGRERAQALLNLIEQGKVSDEEILNKTKTAFQASGIRSHSYSRFLYDALSPTDKTVDNSSVSDHEFEITKQNCVDEIFSLTHSLSQAAPAA